MKGYWHYQRYTLQDRSIIPIIPGIDYVDMVLSSGSRTRHISVRWIYWVASVGYLNNAITSPTANADTKQGDTLPEGQKRAQKARQGEGHDNLW